MLPEDQSRYLVGMASSDGQSPPAQPTEPLDVDGVSAMATGTIVWAVALVVLLVSGTTFSSDNGWWLWVCIVGVVIGVVGVGYTRRRRAVYRAAEEQAQGAGSGTTQE